MLNCMTLIFFFFLNDGKNVQRVIQTLKTAAQGRMHQVRVHAALFNHYSKQGFSLFNLFRIIFFRFNKKKDKETKNKTKTRSSKHFFIYELKIRDAREVFCGFPRTMLLSLK